MKVVETAIPGVVLLEPVLHGDSRGYFFESFSQREFQDRVCRTTFVQDNESMSRYGVVRGNFPAARFIGAVDALVNAERGGNLLLRQIVILSQFTQSWIVHFPHRRYSNGQSNDRIEFTIIQ